MNRQTFNALCAQYATPEVSGEGLVSWEGGKKCVIPSIKLHGAAVQDGEPTPENPVMPVCNNGVFAGRGRNLLDSEGFAQELLALNGSSRVTVDGRDCVRFNSYSVHAHGPFSPFSVRENTQYTIKITVKADGIPETGNGALYIALLYTDETYTVIWRSLGAASAQDWVTAVVSTEPDKTLSYLKLSYGTRWDWYMDIGSIQMVEGVHTAETMPPYTPYYDGGQAQAPELWAIPGTEYRDEWNPQTGRGIRRCGVIDSYAGEVINMPYLSSTGALTEGATVIYGIPDMPFTATPAKLTMPTGYGQIIQVSGDVPDCPISAKYLTHS